MFISKRELGGFDEIGLGGRENQRIWKGIGGGAKMEGRNRRGSMGLEG